MKGQVIYTDATRNKDTVVSRKYTPPFATLASVQNAGGGYARDAMISLVITPSLLVPVKHDLIVGGGQAQGIAEH